MSGLRSYDIRVSECDTSIEGIHHLPAYRSDVQEKLSNESAGDQVAGNVSPRIGSRQKHHLSMVFTLAATTRAKTQKSADPWLFNNLRNLEDHDVGIHSAATFFIGYGATFAVRRTKFPLGSRDVVLKSLIRASPSHDQHSQSKTFVERIEAVLLELRVLTHEPLRRHPNIIKLLQVGWEADAVDMSIKWPVLMLEYADQGTLLDFMESHSSQLSFDDKRLICLHVANGLQALHACGVVHGDLKIENVLIFTEVTDNGYSLIAKLSDFGGCLFDQLDADLRPMSTPPWTAPEFTTLHPGDKGYLNADVYALGMLIWRTLLNGLPPQILFEVSNGDIHWMVHVEEMKRNENFLDFVNSTIERQGYDLDAKLTRKYFEPTLQLDPHKRCLRCAVESLEGTNNTRCLHTQQTEAVVVTERGDQISADTSSSTEELSQFELYFVGLEFKGITTSIGAQVIQALENTASDDPDLERRGRAHSVLATLLLTADDFGVHLDVVCGLDHLTYSALSGNSHHQAWLTRFHKAFSQELPIDTKDQANDWLVETGARGCWTAIEDLIDEGLVEEAGLAKATLKTQFCGYGDEIFEFEEDAWKAFALNTNCSEYLAKEISEATSPQTNIRQYLLWQSSAYGSVAAARILCGLYNVDVNIQNARGDTPLLFAARSGHLKTLLELLDLGGNPTIVSTSGETALHWLSSFEEDEMQDAANALIKHGAELDALASAFPEHGDLEFPELDYVVGTPLHRAVARGNITAVRILLGFGADVSATDDSEDARTAIMLAAQLHYPDILKTLLMHDKRSGDDKLCSAKGESLLAIAIDGGCLHGAQIGRLIRHGRNMDDAARNTLDVVLEAGGIDHLHDLPGESCSALFYAICCSPSIVDHLIKRGSNADVNKRCARDAPQMQRLESSQEDRYRPPLFEAVVNCKTKACQLLLEAGADVKQTRNDFERTSVLYECAYGAFEDLEIVESMIDRGVGIDDGPPDFEKPFQCAMRNGCFRLAELLFRRGANLNATSTRGLFWGSANSWTLLGNLLMSNSPASVATIRFLFQLEGNVDIIVGPALQTSAFHVLAQIPGDTVDPSSAREAFALCSEYFKTLPDMLNLQALGGNTALHYAVAIANVDMVECLIYGGATVHILNDEGKSVLDIARESCKRFPELFQSRPVPKPLKRQYAEGEWRRQEILRLLSSS